MLAERSEGNHMRSHRNGPVSAWLGAVLATACLAATAHALAYQFVDLTPSGMSLLEVFAASVDQQVGFGITHQFPGGCAALWSGTAASWVNLHPNGYNSSWAIAVCDGRQVGYTVYFVHHAALWSGTASSHVDLHPTGFWSSEALAVSGDRQGGCAIRTSSERYEYHAMMWSGSAASAVDLSPTGFPSSVVTSMADNQQAGYAWSGDSRQLTQAMLWAGSAVSAVSLHPDGYRGSEILGTDGTQQVGEADEHAMLWTGTAASAIDLHVSDWDITRASAVAGGQQVGFGYSSATGFKHALLWEGSAASAVDLHQYVPAEFTQSWANGIDEQGRIVGTVFKYSQWHAAMWVPVPEPATLSLLALGGLLIARRRRA
jgi:hypothetical protein